MNINNLSIRQKQIFQILLNIEDFMPCKEIADKLNISVRTIKTDVGIIRDLLKESDLSCKFESSPSKGYRIKCDNVEEIGSEYFSDNYFISVNKYLEDDCRQANIFLELLEPRGVITIKYLTEKYFISRATLHKDLETISKDLMNYNVELVYVPYQGISILGSETDIRFALQNELLVNKQLIDDDYKSYLDNFQFSKKNLLEFINSFSINSISDFELSNLYHHLLTILIRCKINQYISCQDLYYELFVNEFEITKTFAYFYTNKPASILIPRDEIIYFILLMKGCNLGFCNQIALDITQQSLEILTNQLGIVFNDLERITNLSTYMYSFLIRNYNHFIQNTTLLDNIKENHALSIDIAIRFVFILEDILKDQVSNSEISYLAYFFLDIRNSLKKYHNPNKILLVSFSGKIISEYLLNELQAHFTFYSFDVCELYELEKQVSQENYSFIITDVAIHIKEKVPIILINHFMDSNDYKLIRKHLRIILNDLLDDYLENMKTISVDNTSEFMKYISSSTNEYETLLKREARFSYQTKNSAIIYLYNTSFQTTVFYIEAGIYWNSKKINYIFVINITEYNRLLNYLKIDNLFLGKINKC